MYRYAWLEFDGGMWHLVKDLFADPGKSTRRWSDRECALTDLMEEGWTVVRPYSSKPAMGENQGGISGYGLVRDCRHAESRLSMIDTSTDGIVGFHICLSGSLDQSREVNTTPEAQRGRISSRTSAAETI